MTNTQEKQESTHSVLELKPEYYGPFYKYVIDDNITDIDFNGTDLWITDAEGKKWCEADSGITKNFIEAFSLRVANEVSKPFNRVDNLLEAETETLRISIVHEAAAISGRSVCLRKTLPMIRMTAPSMIEKDYMPREIINLLVNCVLSKLNFVIGGEPGAGKTEAAKFFSQFIPNAQRVITIEDSPEWHFRELNPGHDCVEFRVYDDFTYAEAIKTCLRQNPEWIMLSEARSIEAKYLIESWTTGVHGITTIHTDGIHKIPTRLLNMMASRDDVDRLEKDIYEFANVVFIVRRRILPDGTKHRYVEEMGFLYLDEDNNRCVQPIVLDGKVVSTEIPDSILFKLRRAGFDKPFESDVVDELFGDKFTYDKEIKYDGKAYMRNAVHGNFDDNTVVDKNVDNVDDVSDEQHEVESLDVQKSEPVVKPIMKPIMKSSKPIAKPISSKQNFQHRSSNTSLGSGMAQQRIVRSQQSIRK